jgi:hypothetical protein
MARCFALNLAKEEIDLVAKVVDASLNVQPALAEASRERAVGVLGGAQIMKDGRFPENVVKRRSIRLSAADTRKKKSNWPLAKEARVRLKRRTEERRAKGIPSPFAGRVSARGNEYLPNHREKTILAKLKTQVAELTESPAESLSNPQAVVSMVASGGSERRLHTREGIGVTISLRDETKPLEIMIGNGPPVAPDLLEAGEALAFDRRNAHREPEGDFRRTLYFTVKAK